MAAEEDSSLVADQPAAAVGEANTYYWLLLAESHLTGWLFSAIARRIWALPLPVGNSQQKRNSSK